MNNIFRKDGPWAWLCVVAAFITFFIIGGAERSFGIWYVEIFEYFAENAATASLINGLNSGLRNILSPLASAMCHRWPTNHVAISGGFIFGSAVFASAWVTSETVLLLTYGIIGGFGASLSFLAAFKSISDYFDKDKGIALAVVQGGFGLGGFSISVLYSYLFNNLSYFETVTIIAGIILNLMIVGAIYMPRTEMKHLDVHVSSGQSSYSQSFSNSSNEAMADIPPSKQETTPLISKPAPKPDATTSESNFHFDLLKIPIAWTIMLSSLVYMWCCYPYSLFIVDFAAERGCSARESQIILIISSAVEFVSRSLIGLLIQHKVMANYRIYFWILMCFLGGIMAFLTPLCTQPSDFIMVAFAMQLFSDGVFTSGPIFLSLSFEDSVAADMISLQLCGIGVGMITGSFLSGILRDVTGSYIVSYAAMGTASVASTVPFFITSYLIERFGHIKKWHLKK